MSKHTYNGDYSKSISRLFEILKSEKHRLYAIYGFAIFGGLVQLSLPLGVQTIISLVQGGVVSTSIVLLIIFVVAGVLINGFLQVKQLEIIETIKQTIFTDYAFDFADKLMHIKLDKYNDYYLPETVNRFFDTQTLQKGLSGILKDIPAASIQILFGLTLLSFYHPVFIVFGSLLFIVLFLILRFTSKQGMASSIIASDYKYKVAGWLEEMARTIKSFKFSKSKSLHLKKTDEYVNGFLESRTTHFRILMMQYWSLIIFKTVITLTMLVVGVFLLTSQQINIGQFVAAEIVIIMVINSVEKFIVDLDKVYDVLTAIEKLGKISFSEPEKEGAAILKDSNEGVAIVFEEVSFEYNATTPALKSISLNINKGDHVVITGKSGSGKSTLLRLLTGTFKNFTGDILIDNIAIQSYNLDSLRSNTGLLLHQQDIFYGTLRENITMGEDIPQNEINQLANILDCSSFLYSSTLGLDTMLHPGGSHLPNSLVKKILLMRAILGSKRLLLLEEPTQYLDETCANALLQYLAQMQNCTVIIATANDHFTFSKQNKIYRLENGKLQ